MTRKYPDIFTTGEAAKICKVSQQTIIRCFDEGKLKGFRVPGSRFRRIPKNFLIEFMKAGEYPYPEDFIPQENTNGNGEHK